MNKEELIGKLQMVYVGDRNAFNELVGYYNGLKQVIEELQQENKQLQTQLQEKEKIIEKAINYIKNNELYHYIYDDEELYEITVSNKKELLEILERK